MVQRACRVSEPIGKGSKPARKGSDPAGWSSELAWRALDLGGRAAFPSEWAFNPAGSLRASCEGPRAS